MPQKLKKEKLIKASGKIDAEKKIKKQAARQMNLYYESFKRTPIARAVIEYKSQKPKIKLINLAFTKYFGYSQKEAYGKNPWTLLDKQLTDQYFIKMWKKIANPAIGYWQDEVISRRKDGSAIDVFMAYNTLFGSDKQPEYFVADYVDITYRKVLERELEAQAVELNKLIKKRTDMLSQTNKKLTQELIDRMAAVQSAKRNEEKFRSVFNNSPAGIIVLDRNGNVIEQNLIISQWFKFNPKNCLGKPFDKLPIIAKESKIIAQSRLKDCILGKKVEPTAMVFNTKSGVQKIGRVNFSRLRDQRKVVLGSLIMIFDIT